MESHLVQIGSGSATSGRRPPWLKVRFPSGDNFHELKRIMRGLDLHTVCESARCPNIGECWEQRTATFMILGNICTRRCGFCSVPGGKPKELDWAEPERVARAVGAMELEYVVITSVNRDDKTDGGAKIFANTIGEVRRLNPGCKVEVLIPDFRGSDEALGIVMAARPDILNHNIETVPRLYSRVRAGARYERSLRLLRRAREFAPEIPTKSGLMVGLGETREELHTVLGDLRDTGCDIVTIGQYLSPTKSHLPVERFYAPEEFAALRRAGQALGLRHVESGPLVRSSYHAREQSAAAAQRIV